MMTIEEASAMSQTEAENIAATIVRKLNPFDLSEGMPVKYHAVVIT
jgi:hypothetical protein